MAVSKQPQRVVVCEDMPWSESGVVAVKGNDHNEFGLHENTTLISFYSHDSLWDKFQPAEGPISVCLLS